MGWWVTAQTEATAKKFVQSATFHPSDWQNFQFESVSLNQMGQPIHIHHHRGQFLRESLNHGQTLEMVAIPSGRYWMGASRTETVAQQQELPRHSVQVSAFAISQHPITQAQWAAVAALPAIRRNLASAPAYFSGADHPVESISWWDAVEFCDRLSQHTGRRYQLPSEAQWEYACRAGTDTPFHTGVTITSQYADYVGLYAYQSEKSGTHPRRTIPVGSFAPNAFGLHDMHGNVWEWCADTWHANYRGAPINGLAWESQAQSSLRTLRGGSWLNPPAKIRSASRSGYRATALNRTIGFRVVTA